MIGNVTLGQEAFFFLQTTLYAAHYLPPDSGFGPMSINRYHLCAAQEKAVGTKSGWHPDRPRKSAIV